MVGGSERGKALREAYFARCYHPPGDKVTEGWDATGQAQDVAVVYDLGRRIADSDAWPQWEADSEFAGRRAEVSEQE